MSHKCLIRARTVILMKMIMIIMTDENTVDLSSDVPPSTDVAPTADVSQPPSADVALPPSVQELSPPDAASPLRTFSRGCTLDAPKQKPSNISSCEI